MMADALSILLPLGLAVSVYLAVSAWQNRQRMARRLQLAEGQSAGSTFDERLAEGAAGVRGALERTFTALGGIMPLGEDDRKKIAMSLQRAGYQSSNAVLVVLGAKLACLVGGLVVGALVIGSPGPMGLAIGLGGGFLVGVMLNLLPELIVSKIATKRIWDIQTALPDAVDLLVVCLEAGLTFERALRRTVDDMTAFHPTLAQELGQATIDMSVHGRSREEALGRVAERLDSQQMRDLAITVAQSERHGTPTADALRKLAGSVRVETLSKMQTKMARLPTMLMLPSIGFLLPGLLVIVGGPSMLQLLDELGAIGGG